MSNSAAPWTVAPQASLTMAILQARILEWVAISSFRETLGVGVLFLSFPGPGPLLIRKKSGGHKISSSERSRPGRFQPGVGVRFQSSWGTDLEAPVTLDQGVWVSSPMADTGTGRPPFSLRTSAQGCVLHWGPWGWQPWKLAQALALCVSFLGRDYPQGSPPPVSTGSSSELGFRGAAAGWRLELHGQHIPDIRRLCLFLLPPGLSVSAGSLLERVRGGIWSCPHGCWD